MKRITALVSAVCMFVCLSLCGCGDDGIGKGFRFPLEAEPKGLDPQTAADTASVTVIATLFEGLTAINADGQPVNAAATHTVSEDGLTYTFTLQESYWSTLAVRDMETPWDQPVQVVADDFLFAIQRGVDPATRSPLAAEYDPIKNAAAIRRGRMPLSALGVSAPDDKTLVITLEKPDSTFLTRLAGTPFMPCNRAFFEYTAGRYGLEKEYVLSNGAFWLTAWNHNESLLLYKNEHYHGDVAPEAVRYVIGVTDPVAALQNGDLDGAPLTKAQADALAGKITAIPLEDTVRHLWFNTAADPFTVEAVRRSLRDSIEWATVTAYMSRHPDEPMAAGYLPPDARLPGDIYHTDGGAAPVTPTTDPTAAKAALQSGLATLYPDGGGKLRFELLAADDPVTADLARYILQSWQKHLKVYPTLTLLPEAELAKRVQSGNYQAAIHTVTLTGLTGGENLALFGSDAVGNLSRLKNTTVDAAIAAAQKGGRAELEALDRLLWQTCPAIPLTNPIRYYGLRHSDVVVRDVEVIPFAGGRWGAPLNPIHAKKWD
ncbi:MAG: peptide ABC transporter substrate-binding protein [Clostridia bacterium]|nr:peptide ABC transporter substrate-binding protein [Clostridia bacterium]